MKSIKSLLLAGILLISTEYIKADSILPIEDQIHIAVQKNIHHLQKLNANGFDDFKTDLLNIFEQANAQEKTTYKSLITALKQLSVKDLKQIQKALKSLKAILDALPTKTSTLIQNNLPQLVQKLLLTVK